MLDTSSAHHAPRERGDAQLHFEPVQSDKQMAWRPAGAADVSFQGDLGPYSRSVQSMLAIGIASGPSLILK
jgi:hypothetical protein